VSDADALLQSILDDPTADAPRLVYADWLEEHGEQARAELIRVQCEPARLPEGESRRAELEARERALLNAHENEWAAPLRGLVDGWEFRRGFVEEVWFFSEPTPERLQAVGRLAPVPDVLVVTGGGGE
jgi:uncharacterized protein (TIGR02996 family)